MQHPQHGASSHRPFRLRVPRHPLEVTTPYETSLPRLQTRASLGLSDAPAVQSGHVTNQKVRRARVARLRVPVPTGTGCRHPLQLVSYRLVMDLNRLRRGIEPRPGECWLGFGVLVIGFG